jgi:hypothetical protein
MSGETGKGINECVAELLTGATDPEQFEELQADPEPDDGDGDGDDD